MRGITEGIIVIKFCVNMFDSALMYIDIHSIYIYLTLTVIA